MAKKIIITARNKNSFIRTLLLVNYQWLCSANRGHKHKRCQPAQKPPSRYFRVRSDHPKNIAVKHLYSVTPYRNVKSTSYRLFVPKFDKKVYRLRNDKDLGRSRGRNGDY